MGRVLLTMFLAFAIPFVLYAAIRTLFRLDKDGLNWREAPLGLLAFLGAIFSIGTVISLKLLSEANIKIDWLGS